MSHQNICYILTSYVITTFQRKNRYKSFRAIDMIRISSQLIDLVIKVNIRNKLIYAIEFITT